MTDAGDEGSMIRSVDGVLQGLQLGGATLDRVGHRRTDEAWLDAQWTSGAALVVRLAADATLIDAAGTGSSGTDAAARDAAEREADATESRWARTSTLIRLGNVVAPRPAYFLGLVDGAPVFAEVVDGGEPPSREQQLASLRTLGTTLSDVELDIVAQATGLVNWHRRHTFCARCGGPTRAVEAGYVRVCDGCGAQHHPRTDPAVIMLVTDDDDRALLGRQASWPQGRFSTLAGFVEPGESAETAVRREVLEEAGVRVGDVRYAGSQPWPFPGSLMIGFFATAVSTAIEVDGVELGEARWFGRDDLHRALAAREVLVPPGISISRRLIEHWFGEPLTRF